MVVSMIDPFLDDYDGNLLLIFHVAAVVKDCTGLSVSLDIHLFR